MKTWICDIDGTVAIMGDRSPYDWARVGEDLPNIPVIRVVEALMVMNNDHVIFMSGRMEQSRRQTELWLDANVRKLFIAAHGTSPAPPVELYMRADGDYRPDRVVKRELYEKYVLGKYNVIGAIDDRTSVVELWRDMGITCLDVAGHDF